MTRRLGHLNVRRSVSEGASVGHAYLIRTETQEQLALLFADPSGQFDPVEHAAILAARSNFVEEHGAALADVLAVLLAARRLPGGLRQGLAALETALAQVRPGEDPAVESAGDRAAAGGSRT